MSHARLDADRRLHEERVGLELTAFEIASRAGHAAGTFAAAGLPTAMIFIFIRNANFSHNPDEAMDIDDFAAATCLLAAVERLAFRA